MRLLSTATASAMSRIESAAADGIDADSPREGGERYGTPSSRSKTDSRSRYPNLAQPRSLPRQHAGIADRTPESQLPPITAV